MKMIVCWIVVIFDWMLICYCVVMVIKELCDIVIEVSFEEILDVIVDFEVMIEWLLVYQSVEIFEIGDDGWFSKVKMKVKIVGIIDEQVVVYSWIDRLVWWMLVSFIQQCLQDGKYELIFKGDNILVQFEIIVDLQVLLFGFVLKCVIKGMIDMVIEVLCSQVLKVKKG